MYQCFDLHSRLSEPMKSHNLTLNIDYSPYSNSFVMLLFVILAQLIFQGNWRSVFLNKHLHFWKFAWTPKSKNVEICILY